MKKIILAMIIGISLIAVGCGKDTTTKATDIDKNVTNEEQATNNNTEKAFTIEELNKYNGQNGNPAYVAVKGKVYDVSKVKEWKGGKHKNGLVAGKDLTSEITGAPHGEDVLKKLTLVGTLKQ